MTPARISAFAASSTSGGNPAGVVIADALPSAAEMQDVARQIGYSETAFAARDRDAWRVRYFAPEAEVPFCGHATIALGAELGARFGAGRYRLLIADGEIDVTATQTDNGWGAELTSPATWSKPLDPALLSEMLDMFGWAADDLDPRFAPTLSFAGARHSVLALRHRQTLADMAYDFNTGRDFMHQHDLVTLNMIHIVDQTHFDSRNAFAYGGVVEDPATGAAAAAFAGALVDQGWPALSGGGSFTISQGKDMGSPSRLTVTVSGTPGDRVRVGGATRRIA